MPDQEGPAIPGGDSLTEVSNQSWLSRVVGSFVGVLLGFALVPGAGIGLWWNEGRAVQTAKSLAEGAGTVRSVDAGRIDPANDGKLVHVTGALKIAGPLRDSELGVSVDAVRLRRKVEMYQWKEEKHEETRTRIGGGQETVTTYKYVKGWYDEPIDSARFREPRNHANPAMTRRSFDIAQSAASLGSFTVPQSLLHRLDAGERLMLDQAAADRIGGIARRPAGVADGIVYLANDPAHPQIGDIRIGYSYAPVQTVSVIAAQQRSELQPYQTVAGDRLHMIESGDVPPARMFAAAEEANTVLTWILRGVGALAMVIGFAMILRPLAVLASVLPFLGDIVGAGTGLVALLLTAMVAPVVIGLAWMFYRPVTGGAILIAGALLVFGIGRLVRRRAAARAQPAPAPAMAGPVSR